MNRKQAFVNQMQESTISNQLHGILRNCKDPAMLRKLEAIVKTTDSLPSSDSAEVVSIDVKIRSDIAQLGGAVQRGNYNAASMYLDQIGKRLADRAVICYKSTPLPLNKRDRKLYKKMEKQNRKTEKQLARALKKGGMTEESVMDKIIELRNDNVGMQEEYDRMFDSLQRVYDPVQETQMKVLGGKIRSNDNLIKIYMNTYSAISLDAILEREKQAISAAGEHMPTNIDDLRAKQQTVEKQRQEFARKGAEIDSMLAGGQSVAEMQNAYREQGEQAEAPAAEAPRTFVNGQAAAPRVMERVTSEFAPRPVKTAEGGDEDVTNFFEDVDEQVAALNMAIRNVEHSLKGKNEGLLALSEELKAMLLKRQDASGAERKVLDGEIDKKQSEYVTFKRSIDRLNQERSDYSMQLRIISQIRDIRDEHERNRMIREISNGRFENIAALATAVNEETKRRNLGIREERDAVAVAEGTEIDGMTYSDIDARYDESVNDDDKYLELERELGIRK